VGHAAPGRGDRPLHPAAPELVLALHHHLSWPLGALVYIFVEAVPDFNLARESFKVFPRRKRINQLIIAIRDNPSAGNYEELGNLYMTTANSRWRGKPSIRPLPPARTRWTRTTAAVCAPSNWAMLPGAARSGAGGAQGFGF